MNALADGLLALRVSTVVLAHSQAAVFAMVARRVPFLVHANTLARLRIALAILVAVRALLYLYRVDVYVAERTRTILLVACQAMIAVLAGAPTQGAFAISTAVLIGLALIALVNRQIVNGRTVLD